MVLDRALRGLAEAAARDSRIAAARDRLEEWLLIMAAAVQPRAEYAVVHGELGPDHPVAIDIEGLMHDAYQRLEADGLDEDRLALYMLAQRLSLTAGPLRLLDGTSLTGRSWRASPSTT